MGKKQASVGSEGAKVRKQVMAKDPPKTRLSGKTRPDQRPSSSPTSTTASSGSERKGFVYSTPSGKGTPALKSPPVSGSSSHKGSKTPGHDVRVAMKEKKKNETTVRKANEKLEKEPEKDTQKRKDRKDAQKGKEKEKAASKEARKEHQESQEKTSDKKGKDMKEHSSRKEGATEPMDVEKKEERALEKEKRKATTAPGKIENKQATSEEDKREQKDKKEKKDKKSKKQKKDKDKGLEDKKQKKQKEEEEESKEDENADEHQHSEPMSKPESNTRELSRALGTDPVLTDPEFSDILAELSHRYDDHPDGDTESEEMSKADDEQDDQDQKLDSDEEMTGDQDNEEEGEEAEDLDKAGKDEEQVEENSPESSESSDVESDPDSNEPSDAGSFGDLESEDGAKPPGHAAAEIAKATAKAEAEAQGKANSTTHRPEWAAFNREIKNRSRFPVALSDHLRRDKNDLFNLYLQNGHSLKKVAVLLERRVEAVNRVRTGREGKKKMELLSKYSKDKVDTLCAALRSRGMWYWDPDFPGDEEEIYYYAGSASQITHDDITAEAMTLQGKFRPDSETLDALTKEGGPLCSGALPALAAGTNDGAKGVWSAAVGAPVSKAKPPKPPTPATEVVPKTVPELCAEAMQKGLAESADVRKLAISLKATEYGGELTGKLLAVSTELENLYEGYIDLKARKVVDEKLYQKQLDVLNVKFKFTEKAKAAAKSLLSGLTRKSRQPKGKAKAKATAAPAKGPGT